MRPSMRNSKLLLDNLTILIPSFNRRKLLIQNLQFFDGLCKIFINENTEKSLTKSEQSQIPSNVEWINSEEAIEDRIFAMAEKVETEFCCLMCDDEILIPDSLAMLVSFLKDNQDFSSASGMAIGFSMNKNKKIWGSNLLFSNVYHELKQRSLVMDDPKTRALLHSSFYTLGASYAVHRTSNFICAIKNSRIAKNSARYSSEIAFELSHALLGKSIVLPVVYWLRNYAVTAIRVSHPDKPDAGNLPTTFTEWWNGVASEKEKKKLASDLATNIATRLKLSTKALASIIDISFSLYGKPFNLSQLAQAIGPDFSPEKIQDWAKSFDALSQFNNTVPYLDEKAAKKSWTEQGILLPSESTWKSILNHIVKLNKTAETQ